VGDALPDAASYDLSKSDGVAALADNVATIKSDALINLRNINNPLFYMFL
jgi:hypothetical protein